MRTEFAQVQREVANHTVQVLAVQLAVGIIEHDGAADLEDFARGGEFSAAEGGQFVIGVGASAMGSALPGSKTDHAGFDATVAVEAQRAAEAYGFVIGVSGDGHHAEHGCSRSDSNRKRPGKALSQSGQCAGRVGAIRVVMRHKSDCREAASLRSVDGRGARRHTACA